MENDPQKLFNAVLFAKGWRDLRLEKNLTWSDNNDKIVFAVEVFNENLKCVALTVTVTSRELTYDICTLSGRERHYQNTAVSDKLEFMKTSLLRVKLGGHEFCEILLVVPTYLAINNDVRVIE